MNAIDSTNPITAKPILYLSLFTFLALILVIIRPGKWLPSAIDAIPKPSIEGSLIHTDPISLKIKADAIYVLGGSQSSLESRFEAATNLYHDRVAPRIMILSRPGITQYSHRLERNLTNDEWSLLKFKQLGVPKEAVEAITIKEEFFGTLREAKAISKLIKERGYENTILISSPCHTRRVKISFEEFLTDKDFRFFVQASDGKSSAMGLISEFVKLKIYQIFLLPLDKYKQGFDKRLQASGYFRMLDKAKNQGPSEPL